MRMVDPKKAQMIPVDTELVWAAGMPIGELKYKSVVWSRNDDKFYEYRGTLTDVTMEQVPGVKDDYTWLRNIGAIE